jgi:hypothetical protein
MKLNYFISSFIFTFWLNISSGQQNTPFEIADWGSDVLGSQMSIGINTNVTAIGSGIVLQCHVRNTTAAPIFLVISGRNTTANVFLTNSTGKIYFLTPPSKLAMPPPITVPPPPNGYYYNTVNSGETYTWSVSLKIDNRIEPGNYELVAERLFSITLKPYDPHKLVSNTLRLKINAAN